MIVCPADWDAADAEEDLDAVAHRAVAEWRLHGGTDV